jgi:diguanylate cyclase (GGDEF)-like protein/PAS domain S-box-containing protein
MSRQRHQNTIRSLIWLASALIAAAVMAIALTVWGFRSDAIDEAINDSNSVATILAEQTARSVQAIDSTLSEMLARVASAGTGSGEDFYRPLRGRDTHEFLQERLAQLPQAVVMTFADRDGHLIASSRYWSVETVNISDRDFFRYLKEHSITGLYVGTPVASRVSGQPTVFFAKRLEGPDGFAGLAIVGVELAYFRHVYDSINSLRDKIMLFLRKDGTVLFRYPDTDSRAGQKMPANSPWYSLVAEGGGSYRSPGYFDGIPRLVATRVVPGYPLVVNVSIQESTALATWRKRATLIGLGTLLAVGVSFLLLWQVARQFRRLLDSEISLADREAKLAQKSGELERVNAQLDTAISNMSQGLLLFDASERIVICNRRYVELYGLSPDVVQPGCSFQRLLEHRKETGSFVEDIEVYRAEIRRALARGEPARFIARTADGRLIEIVNQPLPDGGWVATHEDVTERQRLLEARTEAEQLLRGQKVQLDAALNNMIQELCMFDAEGRVILFNERFARFKGVPAADLVGRSVRDLLEIRKAQGMLHADPDQVVAEVLERVRSGRAATEIIKTGDGRAWRMVDQPMVGGGWVATFEDITEQRRLEQERERDRAFLNNIVNAAPTPIIVKSVDTGQYILINEAAVEYVGLERGQIIGRTTHEVWPQATADLIDGHDKDLLRSDGHRQFEEHAVDTPGKGLRTVTSKRLVIRDCDGKAQYLLTVVEDVTERKRSEAQIVHMAHHDLLTGLPNRAFFMQKMDEAGARLRRWGEPLTIFILDLDRFKIVNDSLGHPAGDALLKETASRLRSALRETDVLARLGGDEFAIIQVGETNQPQAAAGLADRIIEIIREPYVIEGNEVSVGASIGIAMAPADGTEPTELIKKADLALYRTKAQGRNAHRFFDVQMTEEVDARHQLETDLRGAVARKELRLFYQPIVDIKTGKLFGAEALVRWQHPQRGLVAPDLFIPLAEETGLIGAIGEWVLQRACADAASWPQPLKVAINLSAVQFRKSSLFDVILLSLVESGLAPSRLELEITESVLLESDTDPLAVIRRLKNLGVSIALDDFGTGYSSLSYLTKFPFDKIKIDKSFTQNLTKRAECAAIVSSVRALGVGLNMLTVAEGVETEQQLSILRAAGINLAQGYLFGRPRPLSEFNLADLDPDKPVEQAA